MPQVPRKKSPAAIGSCTADLETARVHWKKGGNPAGLVASDWLLVPLTTSHLRSGNSQLVGQPIAELAAVIKALDALRTWLEEQPTSFSLETAASDCFRIGRVNLTSDIQAGLHLLLQDLGCTPVEKRSSVSRF